MGRRIMIMIIIIITWAAPAAGRCGSSGREGKGREDQNRHSPGEHNNVRWVFAPTSLT